MRNTRTQLRVAKARGTESSDITGHLPNSIDIRLIKATALSTSGRLLVRDTKLWLQLRQHEGPARKVREAAIGKAA